MDLQKSLLMLENHKLRVAFLFFMFYYRQIKQHIITFCKQKHYTNKTHGSCHAGCMEFAGLFTSDVNIVRSK